MNAATHAEAVRAAASPALGSRAPYGFIGRLLTLAAGLALLAAACSSGAPDTTPTAGRTTASAISGPVTTGPSTGPTGAGPTGTGPTSSGPGPTGSTGPGPTTEPPAKEFGFTVIGDFGSGDDAEDAVADEMREWADDNRLDAVVTTGDNVYDTGAPREFPAAWHEPYGWVDEAGIPVIAALGNHDVDGSGNTSELGLFDIPGNWYAETVGPVRFIVLDANDPSNPEQLAWLKDELAHGSGAPWTVVVFHQPAYSCSFHQSTEAVDEIWVPLFAPAGVDLVLNGHDHDYQRFAPIDGVTYIVQGSGGAQLYPVSPILCPTGTPAPAFFDHDHHLFLTLAVSEDHLTGRAITADGDVVDTFDVPGR